MKQKENESLPQENIGSWDHSHTIKLAHAKLQARGFVLEVGQNASSNFIAPSIFHFLLFKLINFSTEISCPFAKQIERG